MSKSIGTIDVGLRIDFINNVLTEQARQEGSIPLTQFIKINNLEYSKEDNYVVFDCEIFEHQLN